MAGYGEGIYRHKEIRLKKRNLTTVLKRVNCASSAGTGIHPVFSDVSSEWLISQKPQIKESSYVKYANMVNAYLNPAFAPRKIEEISRDDVSSFCIALVNSGGQRSSGLSPKTINDALSVLRSIFRYAEEEKGLNVSNISGISVKLPYRPMNILSISEQKNLEEYLRKELTPCNMGILLCMYTGLRIGEICALTWKDISSTEPVLYVNKTMQRIQHMGDARPKTRVMISTPKSSHSVRAIPLPSEIYQLLQEQRKDNEAYVLTGTGSRYMEPRSLENRFKKALDHAGIKHMGFHALRHTFATRCVELGFDIKSLSEILGHSSVNITLNKYVHPSMDLKRKNMNMLSGLYTDMQ